MNQGIGAVRSFFFLGLLIASAGCNSLDRFGTKLDVVARRLEEPGKPIYEGQLNVVKRVGSMTVMQFADGAVYDVPTAPPALYPGDTVRLYNTSKGYEALLWKSVESTLQAVAEPRRG